jgi:hypothetical protein
MNGMSCETVTMYQEEPAVFRSSESHRHLSNCHLAGNVKSRASKFSLTYGKHTSASGSQARSPGVPLRDGCKDERFRDAESMYVLRRYWILSIRIRVYAQINSHGISDDA